MTKNTYEAGKKSEEEAVRILENRGFRIIERNFHSRFGEIDIIATKNKTLYFFEVRLRKKGPIFSITRQKIKRIFKTIDYFLLRNPVFRDFTKDFGLVLFEGDLEKSEVITGLMYEI